MLSLTHIWWCYLHLSLPNITLNLEEISEAQKTAGTGLPWTFQQAAGAPLLCVDRLACVTCVCFMETCNSGSR